MEKLCAPPIQLPHWTARACLTPISLFDDIHLSPLLVLLFFVLSNKEGATCCLFIRYPP